MKASENSTKIIDEQMNNTNKFNNFLIMRLSPIPAPAYSYNLVKRSSLFTTRLYVSSIAENVMSIHGLSISLLFTKRC